MMKKYLILGMCLAMGISGAKAQVTIGSGEKANVGALLDLKDGTAKAGGNATAVGGLGLPRVELLSIKLNSKFTDLARTIKGTTDSENWDKDQHVGLVVYSAKEDLCLADPIYKGLYVWTGNEWQYLGNEGEASSPDVHYYVDDRPHGDALAGTKQIYPYRNFGATAGDWMLENMRYIPNDGSLTASKKTSGDNDKNYCYPQKNVPAVSDFNKIPSSWSGAQGLLYTYSAATLGEQDGLNVSQGSGAVATPTITGICPPEWHMPSDEEWNDLEEELYNNADKYSTYTSTELADITIWNPKVWNKAWNELTNSRGSSGSGGHGYVWLARCNVPDNDYGKITVGKSLSARNGGFAATMSGIAAHNGQDSYGRAALFWTSSCAGSGYARYRYSMVINMPHIGRDVQTRRNLFSVRCKKN